MDLLRDVLEFLARETCEDVDSLTPATRLRQDLALDGDDAEEFFDAFSKRFGVDLSAFRFVDHFEGEPPMFWSLQRGRPITIQDLYMAAKRKVWHL